MQAERVDREAHGVLTNAGENISDVGHAEFSSHLSEGGAELLTAATLSNHVERLPLIPVGDCCNTLSPRGRVAPYKTGSHAEATISNTHCR